MRGKKSRKKSGKKRGKEKIRRRRGILPVLIPILILIAFLAVVLIWRVFVVREVTVVDSEIYTDKQVKDWVFDDEYSWNSLYVILKDRFREREEIPFVDAVDVSLKSPSKIQIKVEEKDILGYIYVPSLEENAYFDRDGIVVELSEDAIDGAMKVSGLTPDGVELGKELNLGDSDVLKTLLSVAQLLDKYEVKPELIYVEEDHILLDYGSVQVDLGSGSSMGEKIARMVQILPELDGKTGTLHFDTWSESGTDVYFKQNELADFPSDE